MKETTDKLVNDCTHFHRMNVAIKVRFEHSNITSILATPFTMFLFH